MAGFEVRTDEHLIRSSLWSNQLKTLLLDDLMATKFVRMLDLPSDFGSSTFNIPSLGEAEVSDFVEGGRIKYNKFDTGNYQFTIDKYKYSANSISEKFKRDSFYANDVVAAFLPRQHRALMVDIESRIFSVGNSGQTASSLNTINSGAHRFVGSGTNETIALKDFARAQYSLKKANVPLTNLVAVVDPSVVYTLQTQANVVNLMSPNPRWGPMVSNTTPTGMKFEMNIYGFDVYSSNYLPACGTSNNGTGIETVDGLTTGAGITNFLFHATTNDLSPWVGAFAQMPTVYSEFNKDTQETEYLTITEYGFKGDFRPENLVCILCDTDQVS
jgi:hypothetical protein